jgi:hypothetical protein
MNKEGEVCKTFFAVRNYCNVKRGFHKSTQFWLNEDIIPNFQQQALLKTYMSSFLKYELNFHVSLRTFSLPSKTKFWVLNQNAIFYYGMDDDA